MNITDKRLGELMQIQEDKRVCWEHANDGVMSSLCCDIYESLAELAAYRRTFAKIEKMLRSNYDMTFIALEIVNQKFEAVLYQLDDDRAGESRADTASAALSALADSIICEELERKG